MFFWYEYMSFWYPFDKDIRNNVWNNYFGHKFSFFLLKKIIFVEKPPPVSSFRQEGKKGKGEDFFSHLKQRNYFYWVTIAGPPRLLNNMKNAYLSFWFFITSTHLFLISSSTRKHYPQLATSWNCHKTQCEMAYVNSCLWMVKPLINSMTYHWEVVKPCLHHAISITVCSA